MVKKKQKAKQKRELTTEDKFFIFKFIFLIFSIITLIAFFTVAAIKLSDTVKFNNDIDFFVNTGALKAETYTPIIFMFIFAFVFAVTILFLILSFKKKIFQNIYYGIFLAAVIVLFVTLYFLYAENFLYYANLYQNDPAWAIINSISGVEIVEKYTTDDIIMLVFAFITLALSGIYLLLINSFTISSDALE
ncbi:MAG: hypothetical protein HPPSJP_3820 [Candidatus Hepatoplasma scabrum]|nr:MAG: hypothetical protein HPPSJP_3820 [Candidatus Hepatoplasma sp.]